MEKDASTQPKRTREPISGWLALLVAGLVFFGPAVSLGNWASEFSSMEGQHPQLAGSTMYQGYKTGVWSVLLLAAAFNIWAGVTLIRVRAKASVDLAVRALWIAGPGAVFLVSAIIPWLFFGPAAFDISAVVSGLMLSAVVASVWTAYLRRSSKVRRMYP